MKPRRLRRYGFATVTILAALILTLAAGGGIGVGQSAYPVTAGLSVDPGSACRGQSVTFSGSGMPADSEVSVSASFLEEIFDLSSTRSDVAGDWSFTTAAPATVPNASGGAPLPVRGQLAIAASSSDAVAGFLAEGSLLVLDCDAGGSLPATGAPLITIACLAAALLSVTTIFALTWHRR